jgi:hypothetical protein
MLRIILFSLSCHCVRDCALRPANAQHGEPQHAALETYRAMIEAPSRTTIGPVLEDLDCQPVARSLDVFLEKLAGEGGLAARRLMAGSSMFEELPSDGKPHAD